MEPGIANDSGGLRAIVVLGCRPIWSAAGELVGALGRRVRAARAAADEHSLVVLTGGRTWDGVVEADAMRRELVRAGLPDDRVLRERCSLTTRDNARLSADLLRRLGVGAVTLVTCDWHVPRATACFRCEALEVSAIPVPGPPVGWTTRWHRRIHEWVALRLDVAGSAV